MIVVDCKRCGARALKTEGRHNEAIKNNWNFFCSRACRYGYQEKGRPVACACCRKIVRKTPAQMRRAKSNAFCSKSCAATYNNTHKEHGARRSRLESLIEGRLRAEFPDVDLRCNTSEAVGSELDFYFPAFGLAIELNGILHYKPIYGVVKFARIQALDEQKAARCAGRGIELFALDVSEVNHLTRRDEEKWWGVVKGLVTSAARRAGHTSEQVP